MSNQWKAAAISACLGTLLLILVLQAEGTPVSFGEGALCFLVGTAAFRLWGGITDAAGRAEQSGARAGARAIDRGLQAVGVNTVAIPPPLPER